MKEMSYEERKAEIKVLEDRLAQLRNETRRANFPIEITGKYGASRRGGGFNWLNYDTKELLVKVIKKALFTYIELGVGERGRTFKTVDEMSDEEYELYKETLDSFLNILYRAKNGMEEK